MADTPLEPTAPDPQPEGSTAPPSEQRPRKQPYPHLFRLLHWVLPAALVVGVLTGLSLHAAARPGWSLFSEGLPSIFWPGEVQIIHLGAAVLFMPSLLAVVWIYSRQKARRRVTHVALLGGGLVMILSGLVLVNPIGPPAVYSAARLLHAVSGLVVLPIALVWHLVDGLGRFRGLLVPAFRPCASPRWSALVWFVVLLVVSACLIINLLPPSLAGRELLARRTASPQGSLQSLPWNEAPPLEVELANGLDMDQGRTTMTLRALHDGNELFVLAEWLDATGNRLHSGWEKTADGWSKLETDPRTGTRCAEDKFSMVFPTERDWRFERFGCATYCHLGAEESYGRKEVEKMADVWHWKSGRTDPVGQIDDKYWLGGESPDESARQSDPKDGGGYKKNESEDKTGPGFLPDELAAVAEGHLLAEDAVESTPEAAEKIPVGTVVPAIVAAAFVGDRGDVRCQSQYQNGRWQLWIRRKLDTGSEYDVRFVPGGSHPFGCAAFDHTGDRHAYALSAYRLRLEE